MSFENIHHHSIDASGVDVLIQRKEPQHLAGIYLFATGGTVIPGHMTVNADTTCEYNVSGGG